MSPDILQPALHNRTNEMRLKLIGCRCPDCNEITFSQHGVCSACGAEIYHHLEGKGKITAILTSTENTERSIEITYTKNNKELKTVFGLNGLSHSARIEINMPADILIRRSSKTPEFKLSYKLTSLFSK